MSIDIKMKFLSPENIQEDMILQDTAFLLEDIGLRDHVPPYVLLPEDEDTDVLKVLSMKWNLMDIGTIYLGTDDDIKEYLKLAPCIENPHLDHIPEGYSPIPTKEFLKEAEDLFLSYNREKKKKEENN